MQTFIISLVMLALGYTILSRPVSNFMKSDYTLSIKLSYLISQVVDEVVLFGLQILGLFTTVYLVVALVKML